MYNEVHHTYNMFMYINGSVFILESIIF